MEVRVADLVNEMIDLIIVHRVKINQLIDENQKLKKALEAAAENSADDSDV